MSNELIDFLELQEPFYNNYKILKEKLAVTYFQNEKIFCSFTYEDVGKLCEEIKAILAMNRIHNCSTSVVGIYCNPGPPAVVCMLGILVNSSFIYLPSDLKEPELRNLIMHVPVSTLIIDKIFYPRFNSLFSNFVIAVEFCIFNYSFLLVNLNTNYKTNYEIHKLSQECPLAYIICTSGSTGSPKLVYVPHKCIVPNIKDFKKLFNVSSSDTILNLSPLSFDPSIVDIFLSLSYGAHLIMLAPDLVKKPKLLEDILENNRISLMQVTPSLIGTLSSTFLKQYFSSHKSPRIIAFGGEVFPSPLQCKEWFTSQCRIKVFNLYGLTEVSCWASYHEVNIFEYISNSEPFKISPVPLGVPLTGTTVYLVDDFGNTITPKMTGNIIIGGERNVCCIVVKQKLQKALNKDIITGDIGYTDGTHIFYVERVSDSIKRNGCKVDLVELEVALKLLPGVTQCCAIFSEREIDLFATLAQSSALNEQFLWVHLEKYLSAWKMPNKICIIEKFPLNQNCKIDKQELIKRTTFTNQCIHRTIKSQTDETVYEMMVKLWSDHLAGYLPQKDDNFVNIGGDSLKAVQLAEKIEHFYMLENPLILQMLLNDSFGDICKLVKNFQSFVPQMNNSSDLGKSNLKIHKSLEPSHEVSLGPKPYFNCIDRRGNYHHGERSLSISKSIKTLKVMWKVSFDKCIDASPLLIKSDKNVRIFIGSHSHKFMCVDENGMEIWTTELPDRVEASASVSFDGQAVYVGCYDGNLYCLNVTNGKILWKVTTGGIIKSSPAVDSRTGCIVFGSYDKYLYCCNFEGEIQWKKEISNGSIFSSPAVGENCIYAATLDGYLVCLDLDGNLKWKKVIGKPIFSSLALFSGGIVFGCTDHFVYCLNYNSEILWKYKTEGPIFSSPFILEYESLVLIAIGSHDHHIYLFDQSGATVACIKLLSPIFSTPFLMMNEEKGVYLVFCETKGEIHIFELELSDNMSKHYSLVVKYKVEGEIFSSPVFHKDKMYVGCRDNYLYCLFTS